MGKEKGAYALHRWVFCEPVTVAYLLFHTCVRSQCQISLTPSIFHFLFSLSDFKMPPSQRSHSEGSSSKSPRSSINLMAPSKMSDGGQKRELPISNTSTSESSFETPIRIRPRSGGKRPATPISRDQINKVQPAWRDRGPPGPRPEPGNWTYPSGPPGFLGIPQGFDPRQPMFVNFGPDMATPTHHHHAYDQRSIHVDSRQVHITPGLSPEVVFQLQHLREADRMWAYEALSAAAREKSKVLKTRPSSITTRL